MESFRCSRGPRRVLPLLVPPPCAALTASLHPPGRSRTLPRGAPPLPAASPPRSTTGQRLVRHRADWLRPPLGWLRVKRVSTRLSMTTGASGPHTWTCQHNAAGPAVSTPQPSLPPHSSQCLARLGWPGRPVSSRLNTQVGCCGPTQEGTRRPDQTRHGPQRGGSPWRCTEHRGPSHHVRAKRVINTLRHARPKGGGPGPCCRPCLCAKSSVSGCASARLQVSWWGGWWDVREPPQN